MLARAACISHRPFPSPFPQPPTRTPTPSCRLQSPCILFIDEFDGLGKARSYGGGGNDESVHTINQLLTGGRVRWQMQGRAEVDGLEAAGWGRRSE